MVFLKTRNDGIFTNSIKPATRRPLVQVTDLEGEENPGDGGAHQVRQRPRRHRTQPKLGDILTPVGCHPPEAANQDGDR